MASSLLKSVIEPGSVPAIIMAFLVGRLIMWIYRVYTWELADVPGLWITKWTRMWYLNENQKPAFEQVLLGLHRKYGPIVRICPNLYSLDDPDSMKKIYSDSAFQKADSYKMSSPPGQVNLFTDTNNAHHSTQKRKFGSSYSTSSLMQYEMFVDNCTELFLKRMEEASEKEEVLNIGDWLQFYAFDVISEINFSQRFGLLDEGRDVYGLVTAIQSGFKYARLFSMFPWIHPYAFWLTKLRPTHSLQFLTDFVIRNIKEHKINSMKQREGPPDLLERWFRIADEDSNKMTIQDIQQACSINIGAGSDTTYTTLSATLYHLISNPACMQALRDELDTAAAAGNLPQPVRYQDAIKLPYLQACIKEAMRLQPVAGNPLPRVVPPGGATLAGRFFPAGVVVGISPKVAHRNASVFGEDADSFRPSRWLEDPDAARRMEAYFMGWGFGVRICLGKNIALLEMIKLIPAIVTDYDLALAGGDGKLKTINSVVTRIMDFKCTVSRRDQRTKKTVA